MSESAPHFVVMWVVSFQVLFYKWLIIGVVRYQCLRVVGGGSRDST